MLLRRLPRVELDDLLSVDRERRVVAQRRSDHATRELVRRIHRDVARQTELRTALDVLDHLRALTRLRRQRHLVTGLGQVARAVETLAIHAHVSVRHALARARNRRSETPAEPDT